MSTARTRKRAISKADFLSALKSGRTRSLDASGIGRLREFIIIDDNDECWEPNEFLDSLTETEEQLNADAERRRRAEVRGLLGTKPLLTEDERVRARTALNTRTGRFNVVQLLRQFFR